MATTPKVVGGLTPECGRRAALVLESLMRTPEVRQVSTPAAAEMAKLLENTYRAVNIALVNELAQLCHRMGIDVWEVIDAAATKPFGFEAFRPGIGPGGHCIPVDPQYLSWKAREFDFRTEFIDLAADTNQGMADYVLGRIRAFADRQGVALAGARVLCLGAAFKAGVSDIRNSRAIRVMELLVQAGARVEFADPLVDELEVSSERHKAVAIGPAMAAGFDLVVVLVAHPQWAELRALPDTALGVRRCRSDRSSRPSGVRAAVKSRLWRRRRGPGPSSIPCSSSSASRSPRGSSLALGVYVFHDGALFPDDAYFQRLAREMANGHTAQLDRRTTTRSSGRPRRSSCPLTAVAWLGSAVLPGQLMVAVAGAGAAALTTAIGLHVLRAALGDRRRARDGAAARRWCCGRR